MTLYSINFFGFQNFTSDEYLEELSNKLSNKNNCREIKQFSLFKARKMRGGHDFCHPCNKFCLLFASAVARIRLKADDMSNTRPEVELSGPNAANGIDTSSALRNCSDICSQTLALRWPPTALFSQHFCSSYTLA